jgi:hypothetical protein
LIVWLAYRSGERLRIKRQLEALENYFKKFLEHRAKRESIYAVERLAQLSTQALLDLGVMMAVRSRGRKPEAYKEVASFICIVLLYQFCYTIKLTINLMVHMSEGRSPRTKSIKLHV